MRRNTEFDEHGPRKMTARKLATKTAVHDVNYNIAIMSIEGIAVLPVGAIIALTNPNVNAVVQRVRLLAGSDKIEVSVCLDVTVPEEYYSSEPS